MQSRYKYAANGTRLASADQPRYPATLQREEFQRFALRAKAAAGSEGSKIEEMSIDQLWEIAQDRKVRQRDWSPFLRAVAARDVDTLLNADSSVQIRTIPSFKYGRALRALPVNQTAENKMPEQPRKQVQPAPPPPQKRRLVASPLAPSPEQLAPKLLAADSLAVRFPATPKLSCAGSRITALSGLPSTSPPPLLSPPSLSPLPSMVLAEATMQYAAATHLPAHTSPPTASSPTATKRFQPKPLSSTIPTAFTAPEPLSPVSLEGVGPHESEDEPSWLRVAGQLMEDLAESPCGSVSFTGSDLASLPLPCSADAQHADTQHADTPLRKQHAAYARPIVIRCSRGVERGVALALTIVLLALLAAFDPHRSTVAFPTRHAPPLALPSPPCRWRWSQLSCGPKPTCKLQPLLLEPRVPWRPSSWRMCVTRRSHWTRR